jgi:hypothetical protein
VTAKGKSPKLTADKRRKLPAASFALPNKNPSVPGAKGDYPDDTPGRARAALGRAKTNASPAQQAIIKKNVAKKYPTIKVAGTKTSKKK